MNQTCSRCGGTLTAGYLRVGLPGQMLVSEFPGVEFILPGTPTSPNLFKAFRQGLEDQQLDEALPVTALRCQQCGLLEFYALNEAAS